MNQPCPDAAPAPPRTPPGRRRDAHAGLGLDRALVHLALRAAGGWISLV